MKFVEGIALQPQSLAASAPSVRRALGEVAPLEPDALVTLVGIGASEHVAHSAAPVWRGLGIRTVAVSAAELQGSELALADVYVAISESGRSAETVAALRGAPGRRIGITNDPQAPLTEVVDQVIRSTVARTAGSTPPGTPPRSRRSGCSASTGRVLAATGPRSPGRWPT